jgi:hypothetical protein
MKLNNDQLEAERLRAMNLEIDGKLLSVQHDLEMERGVSRIYLNTLAAIAKLVGVADDDEDVITPAEDLIAERNSLLSQLKDTVSAWEKGDDVFGGIERARQLIAKTEAKPSSPDL